MDVDIDEDSNRCAAVTDDVNKNENKEYLNNKEFDKTILLLVTGEYENCSITGNWIEKFLEEKDFDINQYDKICVIDY